MTKDEALRLALGVLKSEDRWGSSVRDAKEKAIAACEAALEAKDKPVAYPEGDVVGPCICGSWPGGKCLKCPRITPPQQEAKDEPVQVSPLQFVEMVMDKEDCIGKPIIWAEWPNKENT